MWFSKRYFLSIMFIFSLTWAGFDQHLQHQESLDSRNSCILISEMSPLYLLDVNTGHYWRFRGNTNNHQTWWLSKVSFDGKFIAYLQPITRNKVTENTYRREFNLYLEELESGKRQLLVEHLFTSSHSVEQTAKLLWSPDDELLILFDQSMSPTEDSFGFVISREGKVLQNWEGGVYGPLWSKDGEYLSFSKYDLTRQQGTVNFWERRSDHTKTVDLPQSTQSVSSVWSPVDNILLVLDDSYQSTQTPDRDYHVHVLSPVQGIVQSIVVHFDNVIGESPYIQSDLNVSLNWRDVDPFIELTLWGGGRTWQRKMFNIVTGEVRTSLPTGYGSYPAPYYLENNIIKFRQSTGTQSNAYEREIVLDDVPEEIRQVYLSYYETVHHYWRLRNTGSAIVIWRSNSGQFVTLYDFFSEETITHRSPFQFERDLQISQIYGSELLSYSFTHNHVAYSGIYDARSGKVLKEFVSLFVQNPVFQPDLMYREMPLEQYHILAFSSEEHTVYINSHGEAVASKPGVQFFMGSPDEKAILSIERSYSQGSAHLKAWIHYSNGQPSRDIDIRNLKRANYYFVNWSPNSEQIMLRAGDHINVVSKNGDVIWRFPRISYLDNAEVVSYDWVRCDVFTRWGDIEVIDQGRAERG